MPRTARRCRWTEAACYHGLNRGHARETIFHDEEDCAYFLDLLARYRDRFGFRLYHYCPMSNHFHLLLQLPDPRGLSRLVAGLLVAYWHHYRRHYHLVGHLFQGRFKSPASRPSATCSVAAGTSSATRWRPAWSRSRGGTAGRVAERTPWATPTPCCRRTRGTRHWPPRGRCGRRAGGTSCGAMIPRRPRCAGRTGSWAGTSSGGTARARRPAHSRADGVARRRRLAQG